MEREKLHALIDRSQMIMNINKGMAQLTLFHQHEQLQSVGQMSLKNRLLRTEKKPNSDTDK